MVGLVNGLDNYQSIFCSGVIIGSRWVVTAAHCVTEPPFEVLAGITNLSENGVRTGVKNVFIHPGYFNSTGTCMPDIALIELESDAEFQPISLYEDSTSLEGVMATIIGWGDTANYGRQSSYDLMQADLQVVSILYLTSLPQLTKRGS